ncbi:cytochrome c maturation protein CcmE [Salidesulfovibrio onnuriiensis]|uniref:cytochrome c maturation protein CcmE n=1 Tax=Salidesulfovibrio onnuriiensis TaxID=2583823 RepID=UPI0011CB1128|nr:cytochrome c maturation protein CcmE [Salidesulfovibrio onnuriiensis]
MAKKSNKGVYIVAMLLFLGGLGYLIVSGLSEDSTYFLNVSEALALEEGQFNKARLFGKVSPRHLERAPGSLGADFDLVDKVDGVNVLRVSYRGAVPDTFKENVEVIVEGRYDPARNVFVAKSLVTKCPSKYREQSEAMDREKG